MLSFHSVCIRRDSNSDPMRLSRRMGWRTSRSSLGPTEWTELGLLCSELYRVGGWRRTVLQAEVIRNRVSRIAGITRSPELMSPGPHLGGWHKLRHKNPNRELLSSEAGCRSVEVRAYAKSGTAARSAEVQSDPRGTC